MSLLLGEMPAAVKRTEVADLIASRDMWGLSHLNDNLPPTVDREDIVFREGGDGRLAGEVYTPKAAIITGSLGVLNAARTSLIRFTRFCS